MSALAKWLAARPLHGILALAATMTLPASQVLSGAVLLMLVLCKGPRQALILAAVAAAALTTATVVLGDSATLIIVSMLASWLPAILMAMLLLKTRSLTLVIQLAAIAAIVGMLVFQLAVADEAAFWKPLLDHTAEVFRAQGMQLNADLVDASVMTLFVTLALWLLYLGGLLLGCALYDAAVGESGRFGRFRDLDMGRVLATAMALAAVLALATGAAGIQSVAFALFATFMMQGLAVLHWLKGNGVLPGITLVAVYALLPFLQVLLVIVLATLGYTDAWFDIRRRIEKRKV